MNKKILLYTLLVTAAVSCTVNILSASHVSIQLAHNEENVGAQFKPSQVLSNCMLMNLDIDYDKKQLIFTHQQEQKTDFQFICTIDQMAPLACFLS